MGRKFWRVYEWFGLLKDVKDVYILVSSGAALTFLMAALNNGKSWLTQQPFLIQFSAWVTLFLLIIYAFAHLRAAWLGLRLRFSQPAQPADALDKLSGLLHTGRHTYLDANLSSAQTQWTYETWRDGVDAWRGDVARTLKTLPDREIDEQFFNADVDAKTLAAVPGVSPEHTLRRTVLAERLRRLQQIVYRKTVGDVPWIVVDATASSWDSNPISVLGRHLSNIAGERLPRRRTIQHLSVTNRAPEMVTLTARLILRTSVGEVIGFPGTANGSVLKFPARLAHGEAIEGAVVFDVPWSYTGENQPRVVECVLEVTDRMHVPHRSVRVPVPGAYPIPQAAREPDTASAS